MHWRAPERKQEGMDLMVRIGTGKALSTLSLAALLATAACVAPVAIPAPELAPPPPPPTVALADPNAWPDVRSRVALDQQQEDRITAILERMPVEEKVAQTIQPDISSVTPEDVRRYKFGSYLGGGNSAPGGKETSPPADWLKLADAYWNASSSAVWVGERIPLMWGIDAVHGHANVVGATIFPHNIGLGATRNPELIRRIGEVTAREMTITGIDWDFSPTLAVVRDDRWGRSYEGYSEDPEIVRALRRQDGRGAAGPGGDAGVHGARAGDRDRQAFRRRRRHCRRQGPGRQPVLAAGAARHPRRRLPAGDRGRSAVGDGVLLDRVRARRCTATASC